MKRITIALLAGVFGLSLVACNTVAGAGQDLQKAGETITGAAKK
jgi:predicted small secreted protein